MVQVDTCLGIWMEYRHAVDRAFSLHLIALRRGRGEQNAGKLAQHTYSLSSTVPRDVLSTHFIITNRLHVLNRVRNRRHSGFQLTKRGLQAHGSGSVEFQNSNSNEHADHT